MNDFESQNRFVINGEVDKENQIHSILCQPIYNSERKVIGVAQMINRTTDDHLFTEQDENLFEVILITFSLFACVCVFANGYGRVEERVARGSVITYTVRISSIETEV